MYCNEPVSGLEPPEEIDKSTDPEPPEPSEPSAGLAGDSSSLESNYPVDP
eukprot:CAMPEP_0170503316 /NCGR_PEP_ID=MMETSP0208-20121228/44296_1 /TAXON_ID=197538 /ORGANISM="Strombidium inclinatum, Strain S3" /LENGTH=49 /DNA_ID=CAMNT_0010782897 /DNA_START=187 /DNA_END=336 /DNA_ORIENTATION=+